MWANTTRCPPGSLLFIATHPWVYEGASEYLWQGAAAWLLRQGHPVAICVHDYGPLSRSLEGLRQAGAVFHFRPPYSLEEERNKTLTGLETWLADKRPRGYPGRRETMDWVSAQKPALVVINQSENADGHWCIGESANRHLPLVTLTHNGGSSLWPADWPAEQLRRGMLPARMNYFCSENNRHWMQVQLGVNLPNTRIFRNPYQVRYHPQCPWPEDEPLKFAMVGRMDPKAKGHDLAFEVLTKEAWRGRAVILNLYGDGPNRQSLKKLANYHSLSQVVFHGSVQDIEAVWRENHYLLQPSRFEGMPCTLVEAMLCGRGAVVTDVGGNSEMVEDGVSGFVADSPHVDQLAEAMERCWQRRLQVREIGLAARRRVELLVPETPEMIFGRELLHWSGKT
jgi:glycosyltransferase involved in cell wall biosynthesis